jgi:voltage-gated potassium channel
MSETNRPGVAWPSDPALCRRARLSARLERVLRLPMLLLALAFLVALALPEVVDLPADVDGALDDVNWLIWGVFAFELALMTYLAPDRRRYLVTHWIDVLTVVIPFLRPLRIVWIIVLSARFWVEIRGAIRHRTLSVIGVTSVIAAWLAATLMYAAEWGGDGPIQTYPDALWWAVSTITTVGYGDVYPKTPAGRGVAVVLMLVGISLFGLVTARVAAFFVGVSDQEGTDRKLDQILARLERLEQGRAGRAPDPRDEEQAS